MGPFWFGYRLACGSVFAFFVVAFAVQLIRLRGFAARVHRPYHSLTQSRVFLVCFLISAILVLESVDPQGLQNILKPVYISFLCEAVVGALLYSLALIVVDFFALTSKMMKRGASGLSIVFKMPFVTLCFANFIGFEIVAMAIPDDYLFYQGLKLFGGAFLMLILQLVARKNNLGLRKSLKETRVINPAQKSPLTKTGSSATRIMAGLQSKYNKFVFMMIVAESILLINGIISITADDYSWRYSTFDMPQVFQIVLKLFYVACLSIMFSFFNISTHYIEFRKRNSVDSILSRMRIFGSGPFGSGSSPKRDSFSHTNAQAVTPAATPIPQPMAPKRTSNVAIHAIKHFMRSSVKHKVKRSKEPGAPIAVYLIENEEFEAGVDPELKVELKDPTAPFMSFCEKRDELHQMVLLYSDIVLFERMVDINDPPFEIQQLGQDIVTQVLENDFLPKESSLIAFDENEEYLQDSFGHVKKQLFEEIKERTLPYFAGTKDVFFFYI